MKSLEEIRGVGPQAAKNLAEHGFADAGGVAGATVAELSAVPGFSAARAEKTIEAAKALMTGESAGVSPQAETGQAKKGGGDTKPGKKKDKKKAKGDENQRFVLKALKESKKDKKKKKDKKDKKKKKK